MNELSTSFCVSRSTRKTVIALNRKLDELENILHSGDHVKSDQARQKDGQAGILCPTEETVVSGGSTERTPVASSPLPSSPRPPMPCAHAVEDGPELLSRFSEAMAQLRQRQREMRQLHDRAAIEIEKSVERARQAEALNEALISDSMDDEAELNYLKLKLRILEIQTLPYVPTDDYDGLALGIRRWKGDWAEVHRRQKRRRWKRGLEMQVDSS
ncbi:MAG: hypothetical protein LQ341_005786 [Variospora aurantia]|nr:MAG: hypothetical protein LQ341_005786 [Variospora aurantia]